MLKKDYKEEMTLEEAMMLEARVLFKTMDVSELSTDRMEFSILRRYGFGWSFRIGLILERFSSMFLRKRRLKGYSIASLLNYFIRNDLFVYILSVFLSFL